MVSETLTKREWDEECGTERRVDDLPVRCVVRSYEAFPSPDILCYSHLLARMTKESTVKGGERGVPMIRGWGEMIGLQVVEGRLLFWSGEGEEMEDGERIRKQ